MDGNHKFATSPSWKDKLAVSTVKQRNVTKTYIFAATESLRFRTYYNQRSNYELKSAFSSPQFKR